MKFGLKETTIQKICDVFARYPQEKKRYCMARGPKAATRMARTLT